MNGSQQIDGGDMTVVSNRVRRKRLTLQSSRRLEQSEEKNAYFAKSLKFLGHPNYAPGLCAALCAVLEIASWLSLADLDKPWIEEANRWGGYGRS